MNALRIPGWSWLRLPEVRGAGGAFSLSVLARGIGLVNAALLARLLQPAGYGLYSYAYAIVALLAVPATFGIPVVVIREVAAAEARGQWGLGRGVIRWAHASTAIFSIIILAASGCYLAFFAARRLGPLELATYAGALLMVPLLALDALRGAILTGLRRVLLGQLPATVLRPVLMMAVLLAAWFAWPKLITHPVNAIALLVVAAALAYAIGTWILWQVQPIELASTRPVYQVRKWSISSVPIGLTDGMYLLNQYAGIVILGIFAAKAEVGKYNIAILAAEVIVLALRAVTAAFSPYFARHSATARGHTALQRSFTLSARLGLLVAIPIAIAYVIFGRSLLDLIFGTAYTSAWLPMMILVGGWLVNSIFGSVDAVLNMSGCERKVLMAVGAGATLTVIASMVLIPTFGMIGAAVAATSGRAASICACGWYAWKQLGIVPGPLSMVAEKNPV